MFNAAVLLSAKYNINIQGQFITGQTADTSGIAANAMAAACRAISTSNIVGIVGPIYSRETPSIAGLCQRIDIPFISYAATDPNLSDRNAYPTFYRTVPSDGAAALSMVKLFQRYNWSSCIIIYQNDAFGSGGAKAITDSFLQNGLVVVNTLTFDIVTRRIRGNLRNVLITSATRIVVLWMTPDFTTTVLQHALESDVLGPTFLWILSESVDLSNFNVTFYPKLIGMLTVEPTVASIANAPINATLLNAAFDLWKLYEPETFPGPDNVDYYALFAFDATWILIQSLEKFCSITKSNYSFCITPSNTSFCFDRHFFDSTMLRNIISNITFLGVSGHIQFDVNTTDRINGSYYVSKNIQSSSNGLDFVRILSYSDAFGWQRNPNTQVIWPGGSSITPSGNAKLKGIKLRMVVVPANQFTNVQQTTDASGNTTIQLVGYIPDLINLLQAQLNFIPDIRLAPAGRSYNNLISDVVNGVYDILVADTSVTAARREIVDFSASIFENSVRIVMRKKLVVDMELFDFLKPLSWRTWILTIGTIIFTSILICILEKEENEHFQHKSLLTLFLVGLWYTCCNFIGRDIELQVRSGPGRVLSSAMFFLTLVLVASYTANLASELTILKSQSLISGIDDIKRGKVPFNRIAMRPGTPFFDYYLKEISGGNTDYYAVYTRQQQWDGLVNNLFDVTFSDTGVAEYLTNNVYCNLTIIGEGVDGTAFGIAMPKGWLYAEDLDIALLSIRELGALDELKAKWFQRRTCPDDPISSNSIEVESLTGLFMLFGAVCIFVLLLFVWNKLRMTKNLSEFFHRMRTPRNKSCISSTEGTGRSPEIGNCELRIPEVQDF